MNKLKLSICTFCHTALLSLVASLGSLSFPIPSVASGEIIGPEVHYKSCAQLQKRMNDVNNPDAEIRGFEKVRLLKRMYAEQKYLVYCNGGIIVNREERTICRGYIGYSYAPTSGVAYYYGDWGRIGASPNYHDNNKGDYCKRIK
jgi:hypothetical protein